MTRTSGRLALALLASAGLAAPALAQLRVCAWNTSINAGTGTLDPVFKTVLYGTFQGRSLSADIVIAQEISSASSAASLLGDLNTAAGSPGDWILAPFVAGPDTSTAFYYRSSKVSYLGKTLILPGGDINGASRDIWRFDVRPIGYSTAGSTLAVYGDHMKAGTASSDNARRLVESTAIRNDANLLPAGWQFMFGGDTNIQASTQTAFQGFVSSQSNNRGRFFDPINTPGNWNNNSAFRFIHTQAQATSMDSRYDILLVGSGLIDGSGFEYIGNSAIPFSTTTWNDPNHSFRVWGNDGTSYGVPLTVSNNQNVGPTIAQALITSVGSDNDGGHCPVFLDLRVPPKVSAPSSIDLGTITQNALGQTTLTVSNGGNVALWTAAGIANLQYTLAGSSGVTAPAGTFNAAPGAAGNNHSITIDTSVVGPFSGTVTIQPADGDTLAFPVTVQATIVVASSCYANCDQSTAPPVLNVADFTCFLQAYANNDPYANCDGSTTIPSLNVADFTCFLQAYANGCR